jgi:hypothetical protein
MPIQYEIDKGRRLLRAVSIGRVDAEAVRDYLRRMESDPDYDPAFDGIIDVRSASADVSPDDIRDIAELVRRRPREATGRRAVLVSSDEHFGLMRMFEAYASGGPTRYRVFRDPDEAKAWLESGSDT